MAKNLYTQAINRVEQIENELFKMQNKDGWWEGYLSSSPLASALTLYCLQRSHQLSIKLDSYTLEERASHIVQLRSYLLNNQNNDGGWGDTDLNKSNFSTTLICHSALIFCQENEAILLKSEGYLRNSAGNMQAKNIQLKLNQIYGDDKTFATPIMCFYLLSHQIVDPKYWRLIKPLPFELSLLPPSLWKKLRLSVVSYALPALISMGQLIYQKSLSKNLLRYFSLRKSREHLQKIQPSSGGYLEAAPLTAFVCMSMMEIDIQSEVIAKGLVFLKKSIRPSGGVPIDTNLSSWVSHLMVTSLPMKKLPKSKEFYLAEMEKRQYKEIHPFTHAAPGGWAWTDLSGGVPDADDTSCALIAYTSLGGQSHVIQNGVRWLLNLQNRDFGMPTFCQGWGQLPFDKSCADISAHAFHAISICLTSLSKEYQMLAHLSLEGLLKYLWKVQRENGSWVPLWFGDEEKENQENPIFGTARVLIHLIKSNHFSSLPKGILNGLNFLRTQQMEGGGFGSIEETGAALEAFALANDFLKEEWLEKTCEDALSYLVNQEIKPKPIGLYFASLWYYEKSYPYIFSYRGIRTWLDRKPLAE